MTKKRETQPFNEQPCQINILHSHYITLDATKKKLVKLSATKSNKET